ncbi:MAG: hypothetical protein IJP03_04725 [Christensenellaceae bacterium]|nr:hypothetical protein [Christensenellaceae bacterium]
MDDFNKSCILEEEFVGRDITSIPGDTVVGQADWLKARFDAVAKELLAPKINQLIYALQQPAAAGQLGAPALTPKSGTTVGEQLCYLYEQLSGAAMGQVPDGSIGDEKLSGAEGQLKARVAGLEENKADLMSPAFGGQPEAPTPPAADDSTRLATTAYVKENLEPVSAHLENSGAHVTQDQKDNWTAHAADADSHVSLKKKSAWDALAGRAMKELWKGSWNSGELEVEGFLDYRLFLISLTGSNTRVMVYREEGESGRMRGGNFFTTSAGVTYFTDVSVTFAGEKLTYAAVTERNVTGSGQISDSSKNNMTVSAIYGVL